MDRVRLIEIAFLLGAAGAAALWWLRRDRRGAAGDTAATPSSSLREPPPQTPQRQIARYRIEQEIGRGASGVVHLARDIDSGAAVALKAIALHRDPDDEGRSLHERFRRETEAAQRLRHPDIVAVLDAGRHDGTGWIAMEFVHGRDLRRYTQPNRLLPLPLVLAIGARIARALAHAHAHGVVHRDIKPANVIVDLPSDVVKVADFGVAHCLDAERSRSGQVLGTPSYMAPEQLAGRSVDGRADLYALGVLLFELLAGRLPHQADSLGALLQAIANRPPPDLHTLRPELPQALADVVALALEKRPEVRYASGEQLAGDLDAIAAALEDGAPAEAGPAHAAAGRGVD